MMRSSPAVLGQTDAVAPLPETWGRVRDRLLPAALAVLFCALAFKGLTAGGVMWTDAARHAMNGAVIHDWIAEGPWLSPRAYADWYYAHWPTLSLGYHPPLFPLVEAVAFSIFGVTPLASRLIVALASGACAWLIYQVVLRTHRSTVLACASAATVSSLPMFQMLSQDVMLEMPAMVFVLLAVLALPRPFEPFTVRAAVRFACWASLAVWTKQLAVVVIGVPIVMAVLTGHRAWLRSAAVWGAVGAGAAAFVALSVFEYMFSDAWTRRFVLLSDVFRVVGLNAATYYQAIVLHSWLALGAAIVALFVAWVVATGRWRAIATSDGMHLAWVLSALLALLAGEWRSGRYLVFAYPPLVVLCLATCWRIVRHVSERRWVASSVVLTVAAVATATAVVRPPVVLRGPSEAARVVAADSPTRVIYAGESDGQFAFALRSAAARTDVVVIRGEHLRADDFGATAFEEFATRYGVAHVVIEEVDGFFDVPWIGLLDSPAPSMRLVGRVPVTGYRRGTLHIFRFQSPSARTADVFDRSGDTPGPRRLDWRTPSWRRDPERRP
jgi:4-amino-4-deoxy-L-arabinose transferase-like glycosyltransferase